MFNKILIANRGEIAVPIFRACYDLGLHTVAIYSNEDTYSLFRTKADEAYLVGEKKSPLGAYLDIPGIISLARRRGVTAIHPGYGFLSENADFVRACEEAGIPHRNIIAMQGPFSRDFNAALYDQLRIRTMVSKDSGQPGGVADKVLPALERGIDVIMIERPKEDER